MSVSFHSPMMMPILPLIALFIHTLMALTIICMFLIFGDYNS